MSETTEKLVGIKQVLLPEFKAAEEAGTTKGYMWFVRDNNITLHNYIYLGSRLYGEAEIEVPFDSVITNVISDNSIVVTKTSSEEGTTVELKVNLDPNGGLTLTENGLQIDMSQFVSQSELDKVKDDIKTVNDNLVTSINAINQNVADGFNTINGGIENEIKPAIAEAKKLAVDETERALAAETNLQTNINIETTERKIDVSNLQNNINVETERAKAADVALDAKITANQTAISDLNTKVSGNTDAIANKVDKVDGMGLSQESFTTAEKTKLAGLSNYDDTAIKASIEENKTNIANVRTDLTNESTLQATNYATLTNDLRSEVTRATDREDTIENAVNNIINNGLALQNGKSITAYPNPSGSSSPVEILTITSGNVVNVGSNIGILELESKGDIVAILDDNRKTVAIKEDVDTLITTLQNTIADLTTRIETLEAKNP